MDEERVKYVLAIVLQEMVAHGKAFRLDEFLDGRTVRDTYQGLADWAEVALLDSGIENYTEGTEHLWAEERKQ